MQQFHSIGGLPRSGTTLLCNILAQNPRFFVSSTSGIPQTLKAVSAGMSAQDEIKSALAHNREKTERQFVATLRGVVEGWYSETSEPVVFDKSRAWNFNSLLLKQLYPEAKLIIVVRDLRSIFASIEKQDRKNPSLVLTADDKTMDSKATAMFARDTGMIGAPVYGIEDILRRQPDNIIIIKYESLVANPKIVLHNLYDSLGESWFEHDFNSVEALSTELDVLWLNKFPHDGSGKVEPSKESWSDWVPSDIAERIMNGFGAFNGAFGYT